MRIANQRVPDALAHFRLWRALGWIMVVAIVAVTLAPPPEILRELDFNDKLGHFATYSVVMLWFAQLYASRQTKIWHGVFFVALGIGLEFCQGALGYRSFEYADMVANTLGVGAGALLAATDRFSFLFPLDRALAAARG
jgi:VanZ family protein